MAMGDVLVGKGIINQAQLEKALEEQKKSGEKLGSLLVKMGYTTQEKIDGAL